MFKVLSAGCLGFRLWMPSGAKDLNGIVTSFFLGGGAQTIQIVEFWGLQPNYCSIFPLALSLP